MWEIKWSQEHEGCLCVNMNIRKELVDGTEFHQGGGLLMHSFCGLSFPVRPGFCQSAAQREEASGRAVVQRSSSGGQINKETIGHLQRACYKSFSFI